jgi:mono/diheme cytochrome c family protein
MHSWYNLPQAFEKGEIMLNYKMLNFIGVIAFLFILTCLASCNSSSKQDPADAIRADSNDPPAAPAESIDRGRQLFETQGCTACHKINGKGGVVGPDLSDEGSKGRSDQWLKTQLRSPKEHNAQTVMPSYARLSDQQIDDLVAYLSSLGSAKPSKASVPTSIQTAEPEPNEVSAVALGARLWAQRCGQCHNLRPPAEYSDAQWSVAVAHMRVRVPLGGEEQDKILKFLQSSN